MFLLINYFLNIITEKHDFFNQKLLNSAKKYVTLKKIKKGGSCVKERLSCIMDIGEAMLVNGAEVYRVEDSIKRMCTAFGASRIDIFTITSNMTATVFTSDGESYTQTRRITSSGTDFEKLHRLNRLSRMICENNHLSVKEVEEELAKALACKTYPFWAECLCYALIAGAFTLFFGGGIIEAAVGFVIGCALRFAVLFSDRVVINKIFAKFFASFVMTLLAVLFHRLGIIPNIDKVIIGNIMILIPGIGFTNAMRDLFTGDSIAGLLRLIEAVLIALAIAAGYFLVITITGGLGI